MSLNRYIRNIAMISHNQGYRVSSPMLKYAAYLALLWSISSTVVLLSSSSPRALRQTHLSSLLTSQSSEVNYGRIIVAATVRDVAPYLRRLKPLIVSATEHFVITGFVFFENDSKDSTIAKLKQWNDIAPVRILSSSSLQHTPRTTALAVGRNTVWQTITRMPRIDYVLWLDMDEVNFGLAHLDSCLDLPSTWSVCCANQYYLYYDLWALRTLHDDWMPCDWWNTCSEDFRSKTETMRAKHIPADHPPIPVDSCFGGAALYKWEHVQGLDLQRYNGTAERRSADSEEGTQAAEGCEHVPFHTSLREQNPNFTLFVQPTFLNSGPPLRSHKQKVVDAARPHWESSFANPRLARWYGRVNSSQGKKSFNQ